MAEVEEGEGITLSGSVITKVAQSGLRSQTVLAPMPTGFMQGRRWAVLSLGTSLATL